MLELICLGGFVLSVGGQVFKNRLADNAIRRNREYITPDNRSISEKVSSFVKDYFYTIVPGYNIVRAVKLFLKNDKEYTLERRSKLDNYERIKKIEVPVINEKESVKKTEKTGEKNMKESSQPVLVNDMKKKNKKQELNDEIKNILEQIFMSEDISYLKQVNRTYYNKSMALREEYKISKGKVSDIELKDLFRRIEIYDSICTKAYDKIHSLKEEKLRTM